MASSSSHNRSSAFSECNLTSQPALVINRQVSPIIIRLTFRLADTLKKCNSSIKIQPPLDVPSSPTELSQQPQQPPVKRGKSLTHPDKPQTSNPNDNENFDLIIHVDDLLGSSLESGEYVYTILTTSSHCTVLLIRVQREGQNMLLLICLELELLGRLLDVSPLQRLMPHVLPSKY